MADQEQRPTIAGQRLLEQVQRVDVEIVGRLVQDQQVARLRQDLREQQPVALAAGQGTRRLARLLVTKQEIAQIADDVP